MSSLQLNAIATQVLLDESFRQALLNGQGQNCLANFQLTDQERVAILTMDTHNAGQFIHELYGLMRRTGSILVEEQASNPVPVGLS
jgi:hypothetical protein